MLRAKFFLACVIVSFVLTSYAMAARGHDYDIGVEEDDRLVYELSAWNEDLASEYLGSGDPEDRLGPNAAVGRFFSYQIDDIDESNDLWSWNEYDWVSGWNIKLDYWGWTSEKSEFENRDRESSEEIILFADPIDYGSYSNLLFDSFVIPVPTEEYLSDCEWCDGYDLEGLRAREKCGCGAIETREWQSDSGSLESITVTTEDGEVIYEITIYKSVPGFNLPLILITSSIVAIVAVYFRAKKIGGSDR